MKVQPIIAVVGLLCAGVAAGQDRVRSNAVLDRADANGDGVIARAEFLAARAEQFTTRDRNGDGFIDSADLSERAAARPRITQAVDGIVKQFDANQDGKVDKVEFVDGGAAIFDRADADRNGSLDAKEIEVAKAELRERAAR
jgi:hypothetical protein